jgi:glycosyltransferase involved in cell wall biosynthesis
VRTDRRARSGSPSIAIVHDYLTQRGGAERVVLLLAETFPDACIYTSLYDPGGTFPEFAGLTIRTTPLNRIPFLRNQHRLALPVLAPSFSALRVDADVLLCSSSGWAHGTRTHGRKVVYCHAPARWLYQTDRYLGKAQPGPGSQGSESSTLTRADTLRRDARAIPLRALSRPLRHWDRHAATTAHRYLANSTAVSEAIRGTYGLEAEVLYPPPSLAPTGPERHVEGLDPGFFLCIARLLPYKNVDVVVRAVAAVPDARLVIVGDGPARTDIERIAGPNVSFVGLVDDPTLRWLYRHTAALVSASFEDYGLTPLEAASFGHPSVVLRAGGFLDTVVEGTTGIFFDSPVPAKVACAMNMVMRRGWDAHELQTHADRFSARSFQRRIRQVVAEEAAFNLPTSLTRPVPRSRPDPDLTTILPPNSRRAS